MINDKTMIIVYIFLTLEVIAIIFATKIILSSKEITIEKPFVQHNIDDNILLDIYNKYLYSNDQTLRKRLILSLYKEFRNGYNIISFGRYVNDYRAGYHLVSSRVRKYFICYGLYARGDWKNISPDSILNNKDFLDRVRIGEKYLIDNLIVVIDRYGVDNTEIFDKCIFDYSVYTAHSFK